MDLGVIVDGPGTSGLQVAPQRHDRLAAVMRNDAALCVDHSAQLVSDLQDAAAWAGDAAFSTARTSEVVARAPPAAVISRRARSVRA